MQMTLFDKLQGELKRDELNEKQRRAVAHELLKNGFVRRDYAYDVGYPMCGRIKNVGARIFELRQAGWMIETTKDEATGECIYRLVSKPRV